MIHQWKKALPEGASGVFGRGGRKLCKPCVLTNSTGVSCAGKHLERQRDGRLRETRGECRHRNP
jgi:hypothetical protein